MIHQPVNTDLTRRHRRFPLFGFLKKKNLLAKEFDTLEAAFRFACEQAGPEILIESLVPALVEERGTPGEAGEPYFRIRVATRDGGMPIWAPVLPNAPAYPEPGDLVGFRVVMLVDDAPADGRIVGYLESILQPAFVPGKGWRIARRLMPPHIKPTIRF